MFVLLFLFLFLFTTLHDEIKISNTQHDELMMTMMKLPFYVRWKTKQKTHQEMRYPNVTSLYFATPLVFNAPDGTISVKFCTGVKG